MDTTRYLKPPWMQRHVGNRLSVRFQPSVISRLSVPGRSSGQWRTVPIAVLEHDDERYLVSYRGASDWAKNLEAAGHGRLITPKGTEEFGVVDVPLADRPPILEAYRAKYEKMPTVGRVLRQLPDPADHPVYRIVPR
jgi:deazaflavin-dependent oxidoreductase (nitroreductase family)